MRQGDMLVSSYAGPTILPEGERRARVHRFKGYLHRCATAWGGKKRDKAKTPPGTSQALVISTTRQALTQWRRRQRIVYYALLFCYYCFNYMLLLLNILYYMLLLFYPKPHRPIVSYCFPGFPGTLPGFPGYPGVRSRKVRES